MSNTVLDSLRRDANYIETENGATATKSTLSAVYDMFGLGGAYRHRSDEDCIFLFSKALKENEEYALKCLFYLRDVRGGQGERKFFRVCLHWLAKNFPEIVERNLIHITEYGRYDDLYCLVDTPLEDKMFDLIRNQLRLDITSFKSGENVGVSLLAKWLKSENASSKETKKLADITRKALNMTHKEYRKTLSLLRSRINIVEKLMSENRWGEIEFDKIPSKAGLIYSNTFAHKDIIADKYAEFIASKNTKVNASALYPYELVYKARKGIEYYWYDHDELDLTATEREALNKYWENLPDYCGDTNKKILCVVDTSGSMTNGSGKVAPIDVAISLGMYAGEKIQGAFHDYYISFASRPQLIKIEGIDFVDKVRRIYRTNLCDNTNLEAVFDLLRNKILRGEAAATDLPDTIIVISDMEIDAQSCWRSMDKVETAMDSIKNEWIASGLKFPNLVYWNVDARNDTFLSEGKNVSYVSGCSPVLFKSVLEGKSGYQLCLDILNSERYAIIK